MALTKALETACGLNVPEAYYRVTEIRIDVVTKQAVIGVQVYKDRAARVDGKVPVDTYTAVCGEELYDTYFATLVLDGINPVSSAYLYLKTEQQVFAGTEDC